MEVFRRSVMGATKEAIYARSYLPLFLEMAEMQRFGVQREPRHNLSKTHEDRCGREAGINQSPACRQGMGEARTHPIRLANGRKNGSLTNDTSIK